MAQQDVRSNCDDELMRYRRAVDDGLQQLDWCIGSLHGIQKVEAPAPTAETTET